MKFIFCLFQLLKDYNTSYQAITWSSIWLTELLKAASIVSYGEVSVVRAAEQLLGILIWPLS